MESPQGGPLGNQTFLWGCEPQESLITLGTSLGKIVPGNPLGLFIVCTKVLGGLINPRECRRWHTQTDRQNHRRTLGLTD